MSSAAVSIIQEFLRSVDPRQRRNASVGLASVGSSEALKLLIEVAANDADESVRQHAAAEICALSPEKIGIVKRLLLEELLAKSGSAKHYALAGDLVTSGKAQFGELPFVKSIRYAWRAMKPEFKRDQYREFWQTIAIFAGGLVGGWLLVLFVCGILRTEPFASFEPVVVFIQLLIALVLALVLGSRGTGWQAQARIGCAALLDLLLTVSAVIVAFAAPMLTVFVIVRSQTGNAALLTPISKFFMSCGISLLLARLFTLGLLCGTRIPKAFLTLRALAAVWIGTSFLVGFAMTWEGGIDDELFGMFFALTLPVLVAMSFVFFYRDRKYLKQKFALGNVGSTLSICALCITIGSFSFFILRPKLRPNVPMPSVLSSLGTTKLLMVPIDGQVTINVVEDNTVVRASMDGPYILTVLANGASLRREAMFEEVRYVAMKGDTIVVRVQSLSRGRLALLSRIGRALQREQADSFAEMKLSFAHSAEDRSRDP